MSEVHLKNMLDRPVCVCGRYEGKEVNEVLQPEEERRVQLDRGGAIRYEDGLAALSKEVYNHTGDALIIHWVHSGTPLGPYIEGYRYVGASDDECTCPSVE